MQHDLTLPGAVVSLIPLEQRHAAAWSDLGDAGAYAFHTTPPPLTPEAAAANIARFVDSPFILAFAVVDSATGEMRGVTTFYEHDPAVPRVEIGNTFYARPFWGGETNPHTKLLLLTHAFVTWRCERVALRCDAGNERSARAIERLGARPEGVLRAHRRRHDGTLADTAYYSIARAEWPGVRQQLLTRLEPAR
ncbi:MAG TPA: GNAT family protein [Nocardioidaceae bacterium]|nr:GNAT family protein [Nocardioidaceae bacterium]